MRKTKSKGDDFYHYRRRSKNTFQRINFTPPVSVKVTRHSFAAGIPKIISKITDAEINRDKSPRLLNLSKNYVQNFSPKLNPPGSLFTPDPSNRSRFQSSRCREGKWRIKSLKQPSLWKKLPVKFPGGSFAHPALLTNYSIN